MSQDVALWVIGSGCFETSKHFSQLVAACFGHFIVKDTPGVRGSGRRLVTNPHHLDIDDATELPTNTGLVISAEQFAGRSTGRVGAVVEILKGNLLFGH